MWYRVISKKSAREIARQMYLDGVPVVCFGTQMSIVEFDGRVHNQYVLIADDTSINTEKYGLKPEPWFQPYFAEGPGWRSFFHGTNVHPYWYLAYSDQCRWTPEEEQTYWADRNK